MRLNRSDITHLIIHCAATPNGKPFTSEQIDGWHRERGFRRDPRLIGATEPGLKHIGYHYVIYTNGAVRCGRSEQEVGAHVQGMNSRSLGVCLIGTDQFTPAQWDTLRLHVTAMRQRFPHITVAGHRQFANKICPGFDVPSWLKNGMVPVPGHECQVDA
jgi:N-acetyl-anhydromuramyl-L-alanine amidase AmpD